MPRRGQCRCGHILTFQKGPDGYKGRCPTCGAVVRVGNPDKKQPRRRKRKPGDDPLGLLPPFPPAPLPVPAPASSDPSLLAIPADPEPVLDPWDEPIHTPGRTVTPWLIVAVVAVVVLVGGGVLGWLLF